MTEGSKRRTIGRWVAGFALSCLSTVAMAQVTDTPGTPGTPNLRDLDPMRGLTDPRLIYANDVERASALANQLTFESLRDLCDPFGQLDQIPNPEAPPNLGDGEFPTCNDSEFTVYLSIRELVHSANELLGEGPTAASLGVDLQGLGTSLRWTAAEELAVQGSMATQFSNSQLSNLAARISALRFGAQGFNLNGNLVPNQDYRRALVALRKHDEERGLRGGGASADLGTDYSRWGGFLNGSFGWGNKEPTGNEDAFDFDGSEITLGLDYRFANNMVVGGIIGIGEQTVDFDEGASEISVVDGGVEADAFSTIVFGLYNGEQLSASASLGLQQIDYDVERNIKYPSFNPDIESANSTALSSPESEVLSATFGVNYAFFVNRFTIEPYVNVEYLDITIDAFSEQRSIEALSGSPDDDAFNLTVDEQAFESLDAALGLRLQTTFTPDWGVIVPYLTFEAHSEFEDSSRVVRARYGELTDVSLLAFEVPTDPLDDQYFSWSIGFSAVLRGGRQRTVDGPITGGVMTFLQYKSIEQLENYEDQVITAGIRYEF